jgi:outer membrane lipoprotein-sorting protein
MPYKTYYFEARITWGKTTQGTNLEAQFMRGWYESPLRTRWDYGAYGFPVTANRVLIQTEKESIYWEPRNSTYQRQAMPPDAVLRPGPMPFMSNIAIGPDVSYLQEKRPQPLRTETILGRPANYYEVADPGSPETMRYWIDQEYKFVLKQVRDSRDTTQRFIAEITKVEFDQPLSPSYFDFPAPKSARKVPSALVFDMPFLSPNYFPESFLVNGAGSGGGGSFDMGGGRTEKKSVSGPNGEIAIEQSTLDARAPALSGTPTKVQNRPAVTTANSVTFDVATIRIKISGSAPLDELLKIAESMK